MTKKILITLFISAILTSCVNKRDLSQNTVIAHITIQPDGLHPFNDNSTIRSYIFNYTQKTLIKLDIESLEYIPALVKNMPTASADNLSFEYENGFYLTCSPSRIGKMLAHYELYKKTSQTPGAIVECGVFKGVSLTRFTMFRELFES